MERTHKGEKSPMLKREQLIIHFSVEYICASSKSEIKVFWKFFTCILKRVMVLCLSQLAKTIDFLLVLPFLLE